MSSGLGGADRLVLVRISVQTSSGTWRKMLHDFRIKLAARKSRDFEASFVVT
jgi:hypothetical protein